jgi:predicted transcriptional regulator
VYQKVPGCEPIIDDLLKRVPRFQTQKDVLVWIAKTKGEYFTFGDISEEVEGKDSTISATISNLVRKEFLQAQQWKKGCKIYRLTPD